MSRTVILVLVGPAGAVLGALPPFEVTQPWWPSTEDVCEGARERFGLGVIVLRLLRADRESQPGGSVTYLAQATGDPATGSPTTGGLATGSPTTGGLATDGLATAALTPVDGPTLALAGADDPNRADYARPGGPQATLAWASAALAELGRGPVVTATQCKSWNLSSIWRLATPSGPVWIKEVPPFFGHEPAILEWLAAHGHRSVVPRLIASDGRRMLMEHIPGEELFGADLSTRTAIAADLHRIQSTVAVDDLLALGIPDRRKLAERLTTVVREARLADARLADRRLTDRRLTDPRLDRLLDGLSERLDRVAACGMPDTLVHGDLHPGNAIGGSEGRIILDWGDCVIGNPTLDILRLTERLPDEEAASIQLAWSLWWRQAVPGCDPLAAIDLMRPVAALYFAAVYADFLANIETSEHPYHRADVPDYLIRAAELAD